MISYRGFTKSYGGRRAVDALTLDIGRGEVVALLGPNGSGKTTTLKAAAGLIRPTSGQVLVGEPPSPAGEPAARGQLSYLPQRVSFPETLTGREVVEFYRRLRHAPASATGDVLAAVALNGSSDLPVSTYSGGMTQRLGLAVAMVPSAPILLLDEPTAALDPDGLTAFRDFVDAQRASGGTVLFSSHQVADAERLADRFVVLVAGRLAASITRAELRELDVPIGSRSIEAGRLDALYRSLAGGAFYEDVKGGGASGAVPPGR